MTIKIGDRLPGGQLQEYVETETAGCSLGPNRFDIDKLVKGKTIVVFGVPGAFTPTRPNMFPDSCATMTSSGPRASMKSGAFRSTTPS